MTKDDKDKFIQEFRAKQQELADAAGMSVLEYMACRLCIPSFD